MKTIRELLVAVLSLAELGHDEYGVTKTNDDIEIVRAWLETFDAQPQALDMPDGDGYWAFEGSIYAGEGVKNPKIAQYVCKVFMFHGTLTSWILEKGLWGIHHMHGKWYRLTMPWE
jgi:hypothetical protein